MNEKEIKYIMKCLDEALKPEENLVEKQKVIDIIYFILMRCAPSKNRTYYPKGFHEKLGDS